MGAGPLLPCGAQGWNSSDQAGWQVLLCVLLSHTHSFLCSAATGNDSLDSAQPLPHPTVSKTKKKMWSLLARGRVGI